MSCIWVHHIEQLFGVPVTPLHLLPQVCTCGEPLTYAEQVVFINPPDEPWDNDRQLPVGFHKVELLYQKVKP